MNNSWQNRVKNHEETPPKGVWESIAKELDKTDNKKIISGKKIIRIQYLKWVAAASVLLALISIVVIYNKKPSVKSEKFSVKKKDSVTGNTIAHIFQKPADKLITDSKKNSVTLKTSPLKTKKIKSPFRKTNSADDINPDILFADAGESTPLVKDPTEIYKKKLISQTGEVINDISLMESPNSYVTFIGPNGQEVKISSKFSNIIGYLNNPETEEYLEKVINESAFWKGKFKEWRDKMSDNNMAQSLSNFMDIIELNNILTENK